MDYRSFKRSTLWAMREIAWANLNTVMPEEWKFWTAKLNLINAALEAKRYEDPDLSRTLSGAGRSTSGVPDPNDPPRDVQARVSKVDTSYRTFGRSLNRKTAEGARNLGFRGAPFKKPQVGQLE